MSYDLSLFVLIPLILLAGFSGVCLGRFFLQKPVHQLADFARRLSDGDYSHRVVLKRHGELEVLAGKMNQMAEDLQLRTERIHHLAYHDTLTELPNRRYFCETLDHALAHAHRHGETLAVLFIDLDDFKQVNDTLGHDFGDHVIKAVANRVAAVVRDEDTVGSSALEDDMLARLGGDEFIVLLRNISTPYAPGKVAQRIIDAVAEPFDRGERHFNLGSSIGISLFPSDGSNAEALLKYADLAMYEAKNKGKNDFRFFSGYLNSEAHRKITLQADLLHAIAERELEMWFQPIQDIDANNVVGFEALLRWQHPERGLVMPDEFIPLAEDNESIHKLAVWTLDEVFSVVAGWLEQYDEIPPVHINISRAQLKHDGLVATLERLTAEYPDCIPFIQLELTETFYLARESVALERLQFLRKMGFVLWLDDFGSGYSSFLHLKKYPVDGIKIDTQYIADLELGGSDRSIVQAIIAMAKTLDLPVIAEGVETLGQAKALREFGCDFLQGFLFGCAAPKRDVETLMQTRRAAVGESLKAGLK